MRTDPSRFDRVIAHPDYEFAPAEPVLPADANVGIAETAGPMLLSAVGAVALVVAISLMFDDDTPLAVMLVVLGFAVVLLRSGLRFFGRLVAFRNAPIERHVAVIVKERTDVSSRDNSTATTYYTTLQHRDGTRAEVMTYSSLVGRLAIDDVGVAYVKANTLVEFIRFDVD